ncbi:CSG1/SUR1-like protein [Neonectria punicea]|uniref:CSG1/SUR1-like protein n=1 Tax=Neonectria punicea TaxID=979145 RepID=A0ABR1H1V6_9HYPO
MAAPNDASASHPAALNMNSKTSSQSRYQSPSGTASSSSSSSSSSPHRAKGYDEERLEWKSASVWSTWPKKLLRFPRLRSVAFVLLLIDLTILGLVVHTLEPLITLLRRNEELFGSRLAFTKDPLPYTENHPDQHKIPKILHQTGATDAIPDKWIKPQQSCKDAYSDFEYMFWTDASAREFISNEYSWFVETWDNYPFPIQRADSLRYFVLHYYGGIYLDLDTWCNESIPYNQIENDAASHHAVFKSTTPTGVSNDLMITSAGHPLFTAVLSKLLYYNDITKLWARWLPYGAIMIGSGPFFVSMVIKNYLLEQPSLPEMTVKVVNATELLPYMTDLESASWHKGDAQALMWLGDKQWIWFGLGAIGMAIVLHLINLVLLRAWRGFDKPQSNAENLKVAKLT